MGAGGPGRDRSRFRAGHATRLACGLGLATWFGCRPPEPDPGDTGHTGTTGPRWESVNFGPCALSEDGLATCWGSELRDAIVPAWSASAPLQVPVEAFSPAFPLWGVRRDDRLPVQLTPPGYPVPRREGLVDLGHICARDGEEVVCWEVSESPFPADRRYVRLGDDPSIEVLALDDTNTLLAGTLVDGTVYATWELPPDFPVADLSLAGSGACALATDGRVQCFGTLEGAFDDGPYRRLSGGKYVICAESAEDHEIRCTDGTRLQWGPLRDLVAGNLATYELLDAGTPNERWNYREVEPADPPHVCAITEENAIRCSGWRYDFPDLQAALPSGG